MWIPCDIRSVTLAPGSATWPRAAQPGARRDRQDRREPGSDHLGDLLRALAAALRALLGESRESGDVGEDRRALGRPRRYGRRIDQVFVRDVRHLEREALAHPFGRERVGR
ncbi:MAG: hypothetical protein IT520_17685 [Burkholderiales bacterium]|nr:hypothetical protein [Burkholderiales bacterium]